MGVFLASRAEMAVVLSGMCRISPFFDLGIVRTLRPTPSQVSDCISPWRLPGVKCEVQFGGELRAQKALPLCWRQRSKPLFLRTFHTSNANRAPIFSNAAFSSKRSRKDMFLGDVWCFFETANAKGHRSSAFFFNAGSQPEPP